MVDPSLVFLDPGDGVGLREVGGVVKTAVAATLSIPFS